MIEAIDLSSNNRSVDLVRVKAAGISLVGLRGTIGLDDEDETVFERANACRVLSLDFFVYGDDFPRHDRAQDAFEQGRQLAELSLKVGATVRCAVDIEPEGIPATGAEWRASADAYVAGVESLQSGPPMAYLSPGFLAQYSELVGDCTLARCALWMAAYLRDMPPAPKPWQKVTMWQHAGNAPGFVGHVDGVAGAVDRSRVFGSLEAIRIG